MKITIEATKEELMTLHTRYTVDAKEIIELDLGADLEDHYGMNEESIDVEIKEIKE